MRRKARIDANQPDIVDALRKVGASVKSLAALGKGIPDLLVGWRGRNILLEIKDGSKPPSARKLTDDEAEFFETWRGQKAVANSVDEALAALDAEWDAVRDQITEIKAASGPENR